MKSGRPRYEPNEIRAISYFSTSLNEKETVEELLWYITKNVVHKLGFVDCVIYKFDPERHLLLQHAAYGQKNPVDTIIYNKIAIRLGEGIVGTVAKTKTAEIIDDTSKDTRYIVDDENRLSEICVPIMIDGELFGIIDSEHPRRNFYTETHLYLLTIIAALCAQKIKDIGKNVKKTYTRGNVHFKKLERLMQIEKVYRDPDISLATIAEMVGISACYLSSIINAVIKKSFIDYINGYRVAEVKRNLIAQEFEQYTVVSVGLEAGFNSKSAFYNAFKKHTSLTPSKYRETRPVRRDPVFGNKLNKADFYVR